MYKSRLKQQIIRDLIPLLSNKEKEVFLEIGLENAYTQQQLYNFLMEKK